MKTIFKIEQANHIRTIIKMHMGKKLKFIDELKKPYKNTIFVYLLD